MLIKTLKIKNFQSISELSLEFDKINLIIGDNFTGKSSIAQALNLILTTEIYGLIASSLVKWIKGGTKKLSIEAEIYWNDADKHILTYELTEGGTHKFLIDNLENSKSNYIKFIEDKTGLPIKSLQVLCYPLYFSTLMKPEEQSKMLINLLNIEISIERITEFVKKQLPASLAYFHSKAGLIAGANLLQSGYKVFYDTRTVINRRVKDIEAELKTIPIINETDLKKTQNNYRTMDMELDNKIRQITSIIDKGEYREYIEKGIAANKLVMKEQLEHSVNPDNLKKEIETIGQKIKENKNKRLEVNNQLQALKTELKVYDSMLNVISKPGNACLITNLINCPIERGKFKQTIMDKINPLKSGIMVKEKAFKDATSEFTVLEANLTKLQNEYDSIKKIAERKAGIESQIKEWENKLKSVHPYKDLNDELTKLKSEKQRLQQEYMDQASTTRTIERRQILDQELEKLQIELVILESLIEFFKPGGELIRLLIGDNIEQFNKTLSNNLDFIIPGVKAHAEIDKDVRLYISRDGADISFGNLSDSESLIFGVALGRCFGFPLAILDRGEAFGAKTGSNFIKLLQDQNIHAFIFRVEKAEDQNILNRKLPEGMKIIKL